MTYSRDSNKWKKAIDNDVHTAGGQQEVATHWECSQTMVSRKTNPFKKTRLTDEEMFILGDIVKDKGEIPEIAWYILERYFPMEMLNGLQDEVEQLSSNIHRLQSKAKSFRKELRA